ILRIFIWFTAITITGNVFSKALLIQNRQRLLLMIKSAGLALNIILNTILLTQFRDARGAAIASIIAEILIVGLMLWHFRAVGFEAARNLPALIRLTIFTLLSGAVMLLLQETILIALIAGAGIYAAGLLVGGVLNDADFDLIYRLLSAIPGGHIIRRYWTRDVSVRW
ncbi:MAG: polysaccharide biosynthesis C-terminal domain-containing protein, partial [Aggregatilineales bacterium]